MEKPVQILLLSWLFTCLELLFLMKVYAYTTPKSQPLPHFTNLKSIFAYQNSTSSSSLLSFNLLFQVQKIVQNQSSSTTSWDQSCIVSHGHIYWRAWWQAGGVLIAAAAVLVLSTALFHGKSTPTTPKPVPTSNMRVPQNQAVEEMNTLRFFPNQTDNNCYVIPLKFPGFNHIVRAGFYYGNYDGLSKTPTFDLKIDRENWTTVNTSSSVDGGLPIYHEAIYLTRSGNLTVCLVQTRDGELPFISSLEGVPIRNIYEEVLETTTATLHLVARSQEPTLVALKSGEFLSFNLMFLLWMHVVVGKWN